jgi:hypothetical protein
MTETGQSLPGLFQRNGSPNTAQPPGSGPSGTRRPVFYSRGAAVSKDTAEAAVLENRRNWPSQNFEQNGAAGLPELRPFFLPGYHPSCRTWLLRHSTASHKPHPAKWFVTEIGVLAAILAFELFCRACAEPGVLANTRPENQNVCRHHHP